MKKINYLDFSRGKNVTIREILEEERTEEALYYTITLNETDEQVHIGVKPECEHLVKPNSILFRPVQKADNIGYTKWENGIGTLGIKLS